MKLHILQKRTFFDRKFSTINHCWNGWKWRTRVGQTSVRGEK